MKRANGFAALSPQKKAKQAKTKPKEPDYCDVEPLRDENGSVIWPAKADDIERARTFIKDCAASGCKTLLVPDKDADGLSSGVILYRTLESLGLGKHLIDVHLVCKGYTMQDEEEREVMQAKDPKYIIVLDQGSIKAPPLIDTPETKSLIIDHHLSDDFPQNAEVVSACHYPPVATSSLLTYEICKEIAPSEDEFDQRCAYLACIGTHGDLGNTLKWSPPFPNLNPTLKQHTKKAVNDAVALLNAPRRTARRDVQVAWDALLQSTGPKDLLKSPRLLAARAEINEEVERHTHAAPKFTPDGRIAVLKIKSEAQVHPVIATRWAGYLASKSLEIVMVANYGYLPGKVNFSCRIARSARGQDPPVNIIKSLRAAAALSTDGLNERLGPSFARGHKEASGGIVDVEAFDEMIDLLRVGEKPEKPEKKEGSSETLPNKKKNKAADATQQKNTIGNYFKKSQGPF